MQLQSVSKIRQTMALGGVLKTSLLTALATALAIAPHLLISPSAQAQPAPAQPAPAEAPNDPPTARYAQGEAVDLADIITEWRGYYADVPVYLCVCQDDTCDQTTQWPYREYTLYQLGVALGPSNGRFAEASGANCFDILDGSRPSEPRPFSAAQTGTGNAEAGASPPELPDSSTPTRPPTDGSIPTAAVIDAGSAIRLDWPSGASNVIDVAGSDWSINVLNALDCNSLSLVEQKSLSAQRVVGNPAVDEATGNVAVPVLLSSCVETDQSGIFVIDPDETGGYSLYRTQLVGGASDQPFEQYSFPDEFSSYPFSSILDTRYWNGSLLVRQGSASGAESIIIFRPGRTPAGQYAGCGVVTVTEGADVLCPE